MGKRALRFKTVLVGSGLTCIIPCTRDDPKNAGEPLGKMVRSRPGFRSVDAAVPALKLPAIGRLG
jgi:hypothetical protein